MITTNLILTATLLIPQQEAGGDNKLTATEPGKQAGSSLVLPDFNPAASFSELEAGLRRLDPVAETLREANSTIEPLVEEFKINPSLENQGKLEVTLATFTSDLARKIRRALASREKTAFALQDIVRGVRGMKSSFELYALDLQQRALEEEALLSQASLELQDVAEKWELLEAGEEKNVLMARFKHLYRNKERLAYRARYLNNWASRYVALAADVGKLSDSIVVVQNRVDDSYDRIDDAGEMLAFAAGFRRDATGLVDRYQSFFGDGQDSVRNVLEKIQSIQGRLEIFEGATRVLDETGPLTPMIQDMDILTRGLHENAESGADTSILSSKEAWENKISNTLRGESISNKDKTRN